MEATPPAMANFLKPYSSTGMHGMLHQHIDDRFLEGSRHVCLDNRNIFHFAAVEIVQNSGFQAAEAEIIGRICHFCPGKSDGVGISLFRNLINLRAAGIAEADGPGHLVEGLSCRVVSGPADDLIFAVILYDNQMRMTTRHHQAGKGRSRSLFSI